MRKGDIKGERLFKNKQENKKTYKELYNEFIVGIRVRGRSEYTLKSYQNHNKYFCKFLNENTLCSDITESTLEDYILYIREKKGITNGITINSYLRNISPVIKYGIKKGYILEDFEIPSVKEQEVIKEIYTEEEVNTLLQKPKKKDFVEIRTWTILWVLASTGLRARELRELKMKNVDLLNRTINVNMTKNKKARIIPISNALQEVLEEYVRLRGGEGEDYLFCTVYNTKMAMSTLQKAIKIYSNQRGIEKTSLHLFRHTFITNAVNKNVSPLILQRITGHTTMKELNRYYNSKTTDLVNVIDDIAPNTVKKTSKFKKGRLK